MKNNVIDDAILSVRLAKRYKRYRKVLYFFIFLIILCIVILSLFGIKNYLGNKSILSNNNYLNSLKIENQELLWDSNKTEYSVTLQEGEDKLSIYTKPADDKALVIIVGNDNLKLGSKVEILVIAEDRSIRTYTLSVDRLAGINTFNQIDYCDQVTSDSCIRYFNFDNQIISLTLKHEVALDQSGKTYSFIVNNQRIVYFTNDFYMRIVGIYQDKIIIVCEEDSHNYLLVVNKNGDLIRIIVELDNILGMYINNIDNQNIYISNQYVYLKGSRLDKDNKVRINDILLNQDQVDGNIHFEDWYTYDLNNNTLSVVSGE